MKNELVDIIYQSLRALMYFVLVGLIFMATMTVVKLLSR